MSANIMWRPIEWGKDLGVGAPSSFLGSMEEALGTRQPWVLNQDHYNILKGLKAGLTSSDQKEAIEEILEAICRHDVIEVYAQY